MDSGDGDVDVIVVPDEDGNDNGGVEVTIASGQDGKDDGDVVAIVHDQDGNSANMYVTNLSHAFQFCITSLTV